MPSRLLTFHKVISECERGSHEGWLAFLSDYTPIAYQLFDVYLPPFPLPREDFWRGALAGLAANNFEWLRKFEHQAEREFLYDLRTFLLEQGAGRLDASQDSGACPRPTPESVGALLKGLPLIHQEVLFLKLAGYSDGAIEKALVTAPAVAQKGMERLAADYSAVLGRNEDKCLWPAAWAEVLRSARAGKQENCPSLRQFVRIHEGGFSWYDKDPAEQQVTQCLHCLERWTALREIQYWKREAKPRPSDELGALLSVLPLRAAGSHRKSILARMFGYPWKHLYGRCASGRGGR